MKNKFLYFIKSLKKELERYNYEYYILNKPTISDYEYDMKMKLLEKLENKISFYKDFDSPSNKIGGYIDDNFKTIKHIRKMYSLKNVYSLLELRKWIKSLTSKIHHNNIEYVCEPKYDGVSISLIYKNGYFHQAITRGDGLYGDDVTSNVILIHSIPLKLKDISTKGNIEFRGEIVISNDNFYKLNQRKLNNNQNIYSNARNIVSGTLKLKNNQEEIINRDLDCFIYYVKSEKINFNTHYQSLEYSKNCGFKTPHITLLFNNINKIIDLIQSWNIYKHSIPYKTDGIVIKVNNLVYYNNLGYTAKYPNWAIAYKFPPKQLFTKILKISYQVSKFGKITPVGHLSPLLLEGTLIKKVCLYNKNYIENNLKLHYNDEVLIEKGGEIIPKITKVNLYKRNTNSTPIIFITKCPSCKSNLYNNNNDMYCNNTNECSSQLIYKLLHFVHRKCMNINYIGLQTIKSMFNNKIIKYPSDLYKIDCHKLCNITNIGVKLAHKIINNISYSKNKPFNKVLFSLSIPHVGEEISNIIANEFLNLDNIINSSYQRLMNIKNIGPEVAKSILNYFSNSANMKIIEDLQKTGLQFSIQYKHDLNYKFFKKRFMFTGKLHQFTRHQIEELVGKNGGIICKTLSDKLNFLVVGDKPGNKLKLCKNIRNIKILYENEFIKHFNIN